jgi:hypothetical protein
MFTLYSGSKTKKNEHSNEELTILPTSTRAGKVRFADIRQERIFNADSGSIEDRFSPT